MTLVYDCLLTMVCMIVLPFGAMGIIRKTKARLQNRVGASVVQPFFDFVKFLRKDQTISETATWLFQVSAALSTSTTLLVAWLVPWLSFKPTLPGDDLFLLLYLLALSRFLTILSALDVGSPFSGFGASREAYLAMLAEPAAFIGLAALGLISHSSSLSVVFDLTHTCTVYELPIWLAAALALYLSSIVDLSRMPVDDPTTHLELTMVYEAMTLENSGKNLGLMEFSHLLKMVILYGLTSQCLLHAATYLCPIGPDLAGALSVMGILGMAFITGLVESASVKLRWTETPSFIAYALTMSLFAAAAALVGGVYVSHGL